MNGRWAIMKDYEALSPYVTRGFIDDIVEAVNYIRWPHFLPGESPERRDYEARIIIQNICEKFENREKG